MDNCLKAFNARGTLRTLLQKESEWDVNKQEMVG
jgi:hypothetical protein